MKFGICNEIFNDWQDIDRAIDYVKEIGYDGLEIAPFTIAPYVTEIPSRTRTHIAKKAQEADLEIIGIHWLLVGPTGLHITHPDAEIRGRTADYLIDLAHFCADIGGTKAIFGSPKQRNVMEDVGHDQAWDYATEVFERALPAYEINGVTLCLEHLAPAETNFCQTAEETVKLIEHINHPFFKLILDTKAMSDEPLGRPATIRAHAKHLAHYHANDANLQGPGFGDVDFAPIMAALQDVHFTGYVSVEVFDFQAGPERIATESLAHLKQFA
jgi:sugar phosphate isomerase/epimerase